MTEPRLYTDLAGWWTLLSAPAEYADEAGAFAEILGRRGPAPVRTVLELGSGGGNNASHLKSRFTLTLVDRSPAMLAVSRELNPECEHVLGDMRDVRLGTTFDAVFVHDAVMYATTLDDLRAVFVTAAVHCRPGGMLLVVPDYFAETFYEAVRAGGNDGADGAEGADGLVGARSLRYLEWVWDPDPSDTEVLADFAYMLRDDDGVRVVHDRHVCGVFPRAAWIDAAAGAGFTVELEVDPSEPVEGSPRELIVGRRESG